jgi:starvation-inducible DNA-binding protein
MGNGHNDGYNTLMQVDNRSPIEQGSNIVIKRLDIILADETALSIKTRCALWNIHGSTFYDRQNLFRNQFKQLDDISNKIAKRMLDLGGHPIGSLEEFLKSTRLDERTGNIPNLVDLLTDHETVIHFLREDSKICLVEYDDKVTHDLLVNIISLHKKMILIIKEKDNASYKGEKHEKGNRIMD